MKKICLFIVTAFIFFISVGCVVSLPETFRRTYDEPGIWKSIEVMEGISKDELWRTVVDAISHKFDLEVIEKDSGYIRTSWKFTYWSSPEKKDTLKSLRCILIILQRAFMIQGRMSSLPVIKNFNILKNSSSGLILGIKSH